MPEVKVDLSDEDLRALKRLAEERGVKPSDILQEALATHRVLAENVGRKDELLIKKRDGFQKVVLQQRRPGEQKKLQP